MSSSKKITYTSDFKLKVLDYYFKHGGDENFGLKTKTASHFNIDKKTINRMLNNPDMVKRARRLLAKRHSSSKPSSSSSSSSSKPSSASSSFTSSTKNPKSGKHIKSSKVAAASGKVSGGSSKSTSVSATSSPATSGGATGSGVTAGTSGMSAGVSAAANSTAASSSRVRCVGQASTEGVKVLELPEDPDYSLLKRSINASANGVANVAKLLVTGTEEVRKLILNECDIILECKVCQNLFRSIVNFLAHKRIYCQEAFADVRTLFHRDNTQGVTSQSGTVVVEPEEPPPSPPPPPDLQPRPVVPPPPASAKEGGRGQGRIDSIADRLAGRQGRGSSSQSSSGSDFASAMSHPTHTGSAKYYERLQMVNAARDKLSQDCSVVLEDIRGVSNARLQTFQPHSTSSTTTPLPPMSQLLEEVSQRTSGVSVALGECGEVIKTARGDVEVMDVEKPATSKQGASPGHDLLCRLCNTRFATSKTLSVHQRSHHGLERYVYSCPICQTAFITMWGVVKHLEKVHKKTKHQTDSLKKVIRKNVTKKLFFPTSDLGQEGEGGQMEEGGEGEGRPTQRGEKFHSPAEVTEGRAYERIAEAGELGVVGSTNKTSVGTSAVSRPSRVSSASPACTTTTTTSSRKSSSSRSSQKRDESGSVLAPEHRCAKCERRFMTPQALISHKKFCSLQQMKPPQSVLLPKSPLNPLLRSETPEKRIAIQIRKDYKKSLSPASGGDGTADVKDNAAQEGMQDIMSEGATASKVEALMNKLCHLSSLTCVPCGRRYQTITTLKRHVSVHFNWTRYACRRCPFRSYNRYELTRHATNQHDVMESAAAELLVEEVAFGPLKYSLTEAEAREGEEDTTLIRPSPLHVNSAKVEVNGIGSEAEDNKEEEEEGQGEKVESDKQNSKHTHTLTHGPDTPESPHSLQEPKDSEVESESVSEIKVSDGTAPQKCQILQDGEKNLQNGSGTPVRGEQGGEDIPAPNMPPVTADRKDEKTVDNSDKQRRSLDHQESSDSSTKTKADGKTADGKVTASKMDDKMDSGKVKIADSTHKQKRNRDQLDSSADGTKSQAASKRRTEPQESSIDSTKSQGNSKKRNSPQDSSVDGTKSQGSSKKRNSPQDSSVNSTKSQGGSKRNSPQDSSVNSSRTPKQQKSSINTSEGKGDGTRRNNTQDSSTDDTNCETATNRSLQPHASAANSKPTHEQHDPSESTKTQSNCDPKLPATKKSRKKLAKRRRLNNHPSQGLETTHNTCNGTHSDEKTGGSHTLGLTPTSDPPQSKVGGRVHSTVPQPPENKSELEGRKSLENNGIEDSGMRGEREQSGTGKERRRESGSGSGGVQNSVTEGKQGVS